MKNKFLHLASDEELGAESYFTAVLGDIFPEMRQALVVRKEKSKIIEPIAVVFGNNRKLKLNCSDYQASDRLTLLTKLVQRAGVGQLKFIQSSDVATEPVIMQSGQRKYYAVASNAASNDDSSQRDAQRQKFVGSQYAKVPLQLVSKTKTFNSYQILIGTQYFEGIIQRKKNEAILTLGAAIMETTELTVRAIVGALKVPVDELIRLRSGSTFSLGNISQLETVFEIEGNPYATGAIQITESGNVSISLKDIL